MANKEIHYMSDNGTMFWPATTTTAIIDPTSREVLDVILGKKEDKPIEITECIPSRLMSINSAEDAVTLSSEEEAQLAPLITGFTTTGTKFTFGTLPAVPTDYTNTYSWEIWGMAGITAKSLIALKLHYIDKEVSGDTVRSYWVESDYREVLFTDSTTSGDEPTFLNIDLADLKPENISPVRIRYNTSPENPMSDSSVFMDENGNFKKVILRVRVLNEDNPEETSGEEGEDYWNFSMNLVPFISNSEDSSWNFYSLYYFGSCVYGGILYSASIEKYFNKSDELEFLVHIDKIKLEDIGVLRGLSAYENVPSYPTTGDDINIAFGKINRIVQSHEEVTARALLDLDSRIQNLPSGGGGGIQEITWSALKTLRDGGNLTPGQLYRITDYTCTTIQTDTQSAGHVFDIIVLALSESTLSETAWADHHSGDTYFSNCKLEAWELKYCLSNDTTRFKWADSTNGKGVIYWMKDEWENEAPYDFKNIQFKRQLTNGSLDTTSGTNTWCYTFNYWNSTTSASEDFAMYNLTSYTQHGYTDYIAPCIKNKLGKTVINYQTTPFPNYNIILSNIVFLCTGEITGDSCHDNYFGDQCYNITFGNRCYHNTFKRNCSNITFGNNCNFNNFSERSSLIILGEYCCEISGKENVSNINIANYCRYISIGASCNHITLSKNYTYNLTVGDGNQYITVTSSLTTNFGNGTLEKIYIAPHTNITTVTKTISHNSLGDTFLTTYKPANSVEISV